MFIRQLNCPVPTRGASMHIIAVWSNRGPRARDVTLHRFAVKPREHLDTFEILGRRRTRKSLVSVRASLRPVCAVWLGFRFSLFRSRSRWVASCALPRFFPLVSSSCFVWGLPPPRVAIVEKARNFMLGGGASITQTWSHAGLNRGPYGYWPYALTS